MRTAEIRVDVSRAVGLDVPLQTAVSVHFPDVPVAAAAPVVVCFPGASYSRSYFDIQVPGYPDYSFAEYLVARGAVVVACDYVGLGDSSGGEWLAALSKERVLAACEDTTVQALGRLRAGEVAELGALQTSCVIGIGHSLGGYFVSRQQGTYATFDAVAVLSWTQFLPAWTERDAVEYAEMLRTDPDPTDPTGLRSRERAYFYGPGVPDAVIAADGAAATRMFPWMFPVERWGLSGDSTSKDAALHIAVPVFLGFGADDISPDPNAEYLGYPMSPNVMTTVVPDSGHCFFFAGARQSFFEEFADWSLAVAGARQNAPQRVAP